MIDIIILFSRIAYHDFYIWLKNTSKFLTKMIMLTYLNARNRFEMLIVINI